MTAGTRTKPSANLHVSSLRRLLGEHGWQTWIAAKVINIPRWDRSLPPLLTRALPPAFQPGTRAAAPGGRGWPGPSQFLLARRPTPIPATLTGVSEHAPNEAPALAARMACPACRGPLTWTTQMASCLSCSTAYPRTGAYWDFIIPASQPATVGR
ncbi:hypothetical protein HC028_19375 [Planosporangium flavigriseum]|uniref:Uncharacterized protein n=1 Tax=Planosporangium flavigriseum TaxID=373681 RepID=A0A8J3LUI2_9ACTN|nr:hypothetical protein [Planosporangium flavigriseum]NJC66652.1 hypothetical protein [Planosporangium flavigriseum]GIG73525.1 hypothetical protein Pfl04_19290 [Planosporangium flavigriseum]